MFIGNKYIHVDNYFKAVLLLLLLLFSFNSEEPSWAKWRFSRSEDKMHYILCSIANNKCSGFEQEYWNKNNWIFVLE